VDGWLKKKMTTRKDRGPNHHEEPEKTEKGGVGGIPKKKAGESSKGPGTEKKEPKLDKGTRKANARGDDHRFLRRRVDLQGQTHSKHFTNGIGTDGQLNKKQSCVGGGSRVIVAEDIFDQGG